MSDHVDNKIYFVTNDKEACFVKSFMNSVKDEKIVGLGNTGYANRIELLDDVVTKFKDGEIAVNISGTKFYKKHVNVLFSVGDCVNTSIMELFVILDSLRRMYGIHVDVNIFMPYFPYARQDRMSKNCSSITSKMFADIIMMLCSKIQAHIITMDIHAEQISGFFDIAFSNWNITLRHIKESIFADIEEDNCVFVAPDSGAVNRTRGFMDEGNYSISIIDKHRTAPGQSKAKNLIGNVEGKDCIIVDDILDGGGTLCNAVDILKDNGAKSVRAFITHGLFSGNCLERIEKSALNELYVSDSLSRVDKNIDKIKVLNVIGPTLAMRFLEDIRI